MNSKTRRASWHFSKIALQGLRMAAAACLLFEGATAHALLPADQMVFSFGEPPANPVGELMQAADGTLVGSTSAGGAYGAGTVFTVTPEGQVRTLVEFSGAGATNRGAYPGAALLASVDGSYYGTTAKGGINDAGTVFRVSPEGSLITLAEFTGKTGETLGAAPYAPLIQAQNNAFYGTTSEGGTTGNGTIFKVTRAGVFTTLVEFTGNGRFSRGAAPFGGLVQDVDGTFYGTTSKGGAKGFGTVFKLTPDGLLTTLLDFSGDGPSNKGSAPYGTLVFGPGRRLYGTTARGGLQDAGTAFSLSTDGVMVTLAQFAGKAAQPESTLILGTDGNFYGTTYGGGIKSGGTIFRLNPNAGTLSIVAAFTGTSGAFKGAAPQAALFKASDNLLYGTTFRGGAWDAGTLFTLANNSTFTTLSEFRVPDPAANTQPALLRAADESFYGVTRGNGSAGHGTVFKISTTGKLSTLVEFSGNDTVNKGSNPNGALVQTADGLFYGTTREGGAEGLGTVFSMSADGTVTTLAEFSGLQEPVKGSAPEAALCKGTDGALYGTTTGAGVMDAGTIFKITPDGTLTTLVEFTGASGAHKGSAPRAAIIQAPDGNFYGTTMRGGTSDLGTVFKLTAAGDFSTLVEFADTVAGQIGAYPLGALVASADGTLYGTTSTGGPKGNGTVFKIPPGGGAMVTLVQFSDKAAPARGAFPQAALVFGTDGALYGTTGFGGASNLGTVFKVTTAGVLTTLTEFSKGGEYAESGLVFGSDGNIYGTTSGGGDNGAGGIFKVRIRALAATGKPGYVQSGTARLNASLQAGSLLASAAFEYGVDGNYGTLTPAQALAAGTLNLSSTLSGLAPNTTYHFRTVVTDSSGPIYGADETFTTSPQPEVIVATGDTLAGEPDSTHVLDLGIPAIADNATVAVLAGLNTATGKDSAILAGTPLAIVARNGAPAPKTDGSVVDGRVFVSFSDPVCDQVGHVAFLAKIQDGTALGTGLWSNLSGTLKEVASTGTVSVTGVSGAKFKAFVSFALSPTGTLFYTATLSGAVPGVSMGIWAHDEAGDSNLLIQGLPLLGSTVSSFNVLGAVSGSPGQGRAYRDGTLSALVTLANKRQAIVHLSAAASPEVVLASQDLLFTRFPACMIAGFGVPSIGPAQAGSVNTAAFMAKLVVGAGQVTTLTNQSIFADSASLNLEEIIRKGDFPPGAGAPTFGALADPVYNAQMETAFLGTFTGLGVTPKNASSLWYRGGISFSQIARAGGDVPSVAGSTWSAFSSLALPDSSGPLFVAKLAPAPGPNLINAANNIGLWSADSFGTVRLIVRTGDSVQVQGTARTLNLLTVLSPVLGSPGQGRSYNALRQSVCRAAFSDRTQAILRFSLP